MTSLKREKQFLWEEEQQKALMRSDEDYKDPQSYIYPTDMDDSNLFRH